MSALSLCSVACKSSSGVIIHKLIGHSVVAASVVRMFFIPGFGRTSDPTWTNVATFLWSAIELGVGLVCASIPGIYSGLRHVWPGFYQFTRRHISQKGTKPSQESQDSQKRHSSLSRIPHHAKYHRASSDLPLTSRSTDTYAMNDMDDISADKYHYESGDRSPKVTFNKPLPHTPEKSEAIMASTTISVTRGPRSPSYERR